MTITVQTEADLHLMHAAPDLLEALRAIIEIGKRDMRNPKYDGPVFLQSDSVPNNRRHVFYQKYLSI